jgi:hypothetical protein
MARETGEIAAGHACESMSCGGLRGPSPQAAGACSAIV